MSRRVEITVPDSWAEAVREILEDPAKCGLNTKLDKPNMIVQLHGSNQTEIFLVTIPGPAVSPTLEQLRKHGIGSQVGRIILTSIEFTKPDLTKPLTVHEEVKIDGKKPKALKGYQHFQKARKTTEELYNEISTGANMTINTWVNLIGACTMAAGGLVTNVTVFIVASMLISPIMGPILGMTFGYRVADFQLFKMGFINECKMAISAYLVGVVCGFILGDVGNTYKWPNSAMMPEGQGFNLIISILVAAAAGSVLGVALTASGGNSLVGTAISAGLLPPLVNAGMLQTYSFTYAKKEQQADFYEMGNYAILFYLTHVITIILVSNTVFWLKDIDKRFKDGDDVSFDDIPSLRAHKERLLKKQQHLQLQQQLKNGGGASGGVGGAGGISVGEGGSGFAGLDLEKLNFQEEKARSEYFWKNVKEDARMEWDNLVSKVTFGKYGKERVDREEEEEEEEYEGEEGGVGEGVDDPEDGTSERGEGGGVRRGGMAGGYSQLTAGRERGLGGGGGGGGRGGRGGRVGGGEEDDLGNFNDLSRESGGGIEMSSYPYPSPSSPSQFNPSSSSNYLPSAYPRQPSSSTAVLSPFHQPSPPPPPPSTLQYQQQRPSSRSPSSPTQGGLSSSDPDEDL